MSGCRQALCLAAVQAGCGYSSTMPGLATWTLTLTRLTWRGHDSAEGLDFHTPSAHSFSPIPARRTIRIRQTGRAVTGRLNTLHRLA